jgi:hypothetical protein
LKNGNIHIGCNWYAAVSVFFFTTESAKKHKVTIQYGDVGRMSGFKTGIKKTRLFELQLALFASSLHWEICCPREQGVNDPNNLKDVQHVTKFASGLEDFVKRLQQSIIYNSSDTQSQSCGVWGMGVTGKTLLSQMPTMVMKCANIWKEL